ncbi:hypothetical protein [Wolbachia endosymbiont (group A) of Tiphia femorata]|nr:hypothetical protein [Wolbachia endosymbiont (group A) of Tiphia femorata]
MPFFCLVNFLIFMAKDCTNVAITKAFLLGSVDKKYEKREKDGSLA